YLWMAVSQQSVVVSRDEHVSRTSFAQHLPVPPASTCALTCSKDFVFLFSLAGPAGRIARPVKSTFRHLSISGHVLFDKTPPNPSCNRGDFHYPHTFGHSGH